MRYSKEDIRALVEGRCSWAALKSMMSSPKDKDRFTLYLEVLQERVPWDEEILVPLGEHLYVVQKGDARVVKCDCGHEFGDYRENWKHSSLVYVRDSEEALEEIYEGYHAPDPSWCVLREFYCPGCLALLEVEAVPPGYPVIFDFLPDIDGFNSVDA